MKTNRWPPERDAKLLSMNAAGMSNTAIGAVFGIDRSAVYQRLKFLGVAMKEHRVVARALKVQPSMEAAAEPKMVVVYGDLVIRKTFRDVPDAKSTAAELAKLRISLADVWPEVKA